MKLPLCYYGNPILRKHCDPIEKITDEIRQLAMDMIETFDKGKGIGLAASQVGRPIRLFTFRDYIETPDGKLTVSEPKVYINPKLSNPSKETTVEVEGCLSLPGLWLKVSRPIKIMVEAIDLNGNPIAEEVEGYNARIRMHENDHLNGMLFTDRIDIHEKRKIESFLRDLKKKYHP